MNWSFCWAAVWMTLAAGCEMGTPAQAGTEAGVTARKAEATPEIIAKAEALLKEHPEAKVGAEFPFRLNGKSYVGRVEEHDNPTGEPGRPAGKHKGITVYVAK